MRQTWICIALIIANSAEPASVSISSGTRITLSPICQAGKGPAVEVRLENIILEPLNSLEAVMPWRNWGQVKFAPEDSDFEVIPWVDSSHYTARVLIAPGKSVSGILTLWDKIEPRNVAGMRLLRWNYGKLHSGVLGLDFDSCPVLWNPSQ